MRVRYDAHAGCPDERAFFDAVRARTSRVRLAAASEEARTFRVSIEKRGPNSVGRIVIEDVHEASAPRTVSAEACAEAINALALIAALSVDPNASLAPLPSAAPTPSATPATTATTDAGVEPPIDAATPTATDAAVEIPIAPRPEPGPEEPSLPITLRHAVGARADGMGFVAPGLRLGLRLQYALSFERGVAFSPALRLSFAWSESGELTTPSARATFTWWTGRLAACPFVWPSAPDRSIAFRPCAALDLGAVRAEGSVIARPQTRTRPWALAGATALVEWSPGPLGLEFELGAGAPLYREDFFFAPNEVVYTPPPVVLHGGAGVVWHFP